MKQSPLYVLGFLEYTSTNRVPKPGMDSANQNEALRNGDKLNCVGQDPPPPTRLTLAKGCICGPNPMGIPLSIFLCFVLCF